jgi:hypothetical protein
MKLSQIYLIFLGTVFLFARSHAQSTPLDISQIAKAFGFPVSELTIQNTLAEETKLTGGTLLSSYRVTSPTPFSFYPLQITVANERTFLDPKALQIITQADSLPDLPINKGGRGPMGSFSLGEGVSGGIYVGEIKSDPQRASVAGYFKNPAAIAELRIPAKHLDVRIALIHAFGPDKLVKVVGGEGYYESLYSPSESSGGDGPSPRQSFDVRKVLTTVGKLVAASPLIVDSRGAVSVVEPHNSPNAVDKTAVAKTNSLEPIAELRGLARLANRPIEFYGLVIDQDGTPIPGVKVTFQVRVMKEPRPGAMGDLFDDITTTSDARGHFSLTDAKGSVLTVKVLEKEGYQPSSKAINRSYRYWDNENDRFKPDAVQPEVFRMWKKVGAEQLVRKGISAPLRCDGTAVTFDLLNGSVASSGDLRVTLVRNPNQITYGQRNYEWTFTVEVVNGGLVESNDEQMYRAPAEGYQPKMVIHMPADATDWTAEKSFNLYLKLRGGQQYGRAELKVLVGSDRQTTPFYITSFINPSGSQNLEYDSLQNVGK